MHPDLLSAISPVLLSPLPPVPSLPPSLALFPGYLLLLLKKKKNCTVKRNTLHYILCEKQFFFLQHLVIVWVERRPFEVLSGSAVTARLHTTRRIIYPDGVNCRIKEWLFSVDHCRAPAHPTTNPNLPPLPQPHCGPFPHSHGNVRAHTQPVKRTET